jgi:AcrR family transcriptional regulator
MQPPPKKPRRTAERILDVALELLNRFGEPNVSTTLIAAELGISPGNLYYHYPAKEALINALYVRYETALEAQLAQAGGIASIGAAWAFFRTLFATTWAYRFLHRDLNDLLSKNRTLEARFQDVLVRQTAAVVAAIDGLARSGAVRMTPHDAAVLSPCLVVLLTWWLNHEYVRDPRRALEPERAEATLDRAVYHLLGLLQPYLSADARAHWQSQVDARASADAH